MIVKKVIMELVGLCESISGGYQKCECLGGLACLAIKLGSCSWFLSVPSTPVVKPPSTVGVATNPASLLMGGVVII